MTTPADIYTPRVPIAEFIPAYPGRAGERGLLAATSAPLCGVGDKQQGIIYIAGYGGHTSGPIGRVTRVVLHGTVSGCYRGGARAVAEYFTQARSGGLAHYVVDPGETVQCAPESLATWGAPPNEGEIHVELCDPQSGDPARWDDADHQAMLLIAAGLVRDICDRHGLPVAAVDARAMLAGRDGVTQHLWVSQAWGQTNHSDPQGGGPFDVIRFISQASDVNVPAVPASPPPTTPYHPEDLAPAALGIYEFGPRCMAMQRAIGVSPADGYFGPGTDAAVRAWQAAHHLIADGLFGPACEAALKGGAPGPAPAPTAGGLTVDGLWGWGTTQALQRALRIPADGIYGPQTKRAMQARLGVPADGVVGPQTIRALQAHVGVAVDGVLGPETVRGLQRALNAGTF